MPTPTPTPTLTLALPLPQTQEGEHGVFALGVPLGQGGEHQGDDRAMRYVLHHLVATELEAVDEGAVGAQVLDAHAALAEADDGVDTADLRVINA